MIDDVIHISIWGNWANSFGMSITVSKEAAAMMALGVAVAAMVSLTLLMDGKNK